MLKNEAAATVAKWSCKHSGSVTASVNIKKLKIIGTSSIPLFAFAKYISVELTMVSTHPNYSS